jgi:hypothetical protein
LRSAMRSARRLSIFPAWVAIALSFNKTRVQLIQAKVGTKVKQKEEQSK